MATINVLDAAGESKPVELPNGNGRASAANSRPVTLANEDLAAINAITTALGNAEFYPATQPVSGTVAVTGTFWQATQPVSVASMPLPTGAATAAGQEAIITAIEGISPGGGGGGDASAANQLAQTAVLENIEAALGGELTVTGALTDTQLRASAVPVDVEFPETQAVSGTVAVSGSVAVTGSFWQTTQPVSVASLPLPTGAATQTTLAAIESALGSTLTVEFSSAPEVTVSGTVAVSAAALPLPTGAATAAKQDDALAAVRALAGPDYETVAASQTEQDLGASGAQGDYLAALLIVPASTSPGAVSIKDGAGGAITVFAGGADSVSTLHPFTVPLGIVSASGAWQVNTGANVSVVASGRFS